MQSMGKLEKKDTTELKKGERLTKSVMANAHRVGDCGHEADGEAYKIA